MGCCFFQKLRLNLSLILEMWKWMELKILPRHNFISQTTSLSLSLSIFLIYHTLYVCIHISLFLSFFLSFSLSVSFLSLISLFLPLSFSFSPSLSFSLSLSLSLFVYLHFISLFRLLFFFPSFSHSLFLSHLHSYSVCTISLSSTGLSSLSFAPCSLFFAISCFPISNSFF